MGEVVTAQRAPNGYICRQAESVDLRERHVWGRWKSVHDVGAAAT